MTLVFLFTFAIGQMWGADVTFNCYNSSTYWGSSSGTVTSKTAVSDAYTVAFTKVGSNSNNSLSGSSVDGGYANLQIGNTINISAKSTGFTKVVIIFTEKNRGPAKNDTWSNYFTANTGTLSKTSDTEFEWTGSSSTSLTLSNVNPGSGALAFRVKTIIITPTSGGSSTDPDPVDETAPTLASSIPAANATNVAVSGNIVLTMSEGVSIADASKFSISGGAGSLTTASIAASGAAVTVPYAELANSTAYTLTVAKGALKDAAENENEAFTVAFTTAAPLAEPDYVLVRNNGTLNTDDFITGGTFENNKSWKVGDVTYTSGLKFNNASSSLQFNDNGRFVAYNTKTDAAHVDIAVYNTNSSATVVKVAIIRENANGSLTLVQDEEYNLAARTGSSSSNYVYGYWTGSFDLTGRSTMYVYEKSNSGRIRICQMAVYETGSNNNLAAPAIGYSVNLNKGRMFVAAATATTFEGLTYCLPNKYQPNNTASATIKAKGEDYISFTIPAGQARQLQVKASGSYNVSKTKGDESSYVSGNQNFNLTEGTWYINPNGSNVTITSIAFATAPTAYTVTYSKGDGSVKEGKTIPTQAATIEGGKFNVASGENLEKEGYDFAGWKYTPAVGDPVIYNAGQEFTMPAANVEFVAQWNVHETSDDVALGTLSVNGEAITIVPSQTVYAVELSFGTTATPTVTATANDENVKAFTITQATAVDGSATIYVKAEDNTTEATYTINFTVADSKDLLLVFRTGTAACSDASTASAMLSDNAAVSSYINQITFNNVEGTGDNGKETGGGSGSLDVGKKAGNMLTLSAKPGYALQAMSFYGKIQDETCEYSLNGGAWQTLSSTDQGADKCYAVFADAEVHEFRLRSTGASGVWIRNMELTMIQACTPKTIAWTAAPASEYEVGATVDPIAASANYGNVTYAASNAAITVAANGALTINSLTNDVDITASVAGGDGTTYCAAGASVAKEDIKTYYLVKFNAQNETDATEVKYYSGDDAIALPTPSYSGYNFQGWFDAATGGNQITAAIIPTASRTVYAQWEAQCVGPTITTQPASANYFTGRTSVALTGAATAGNGGALTYTWYSCDDAERNNPVALSGAPTPSTVVVGTQYYYFTVTEAGCDVVKTSNVAVITVADKDMLCLVKANVGDKTLTYDNTSFYAENKVTLAENDLIKGKDESYYAGYKFQSGAILQVGLKEASFEENDIIEVYVGAVANSGGYQKMRAFNADEAVSANIVAESAENMVEGVNRIVLTEDAADLYFMRKDDYDKWNPHVAYVAVYRAYPVPVLTAMTVNGSAATISGTNVTATIASNAELASLTIVPTFMSNDPSLTNGALGVWSEVSEGVYTASYVVTDKDNDTNTYTITLTRDVEIASVTISGETTVAAESQITLTATVLPNNVLNKEVTWSSSDETKAVVDANGIVTGKAAGAVTITATAVADNTKKGTYDITVTPFIGTKYAYWFTETGDIPSDLANDNGDIFDGAPTDGSGLNASMTVEINGVDREFTVTRRSGDVGFGTFHVPAGFTADLYMLVQGSGDGRTIQLKETTTEATYKSDLESFGSSAAKLVFSAIPAGNYSYDKIGGNSRVAMMVAALNSYPLSSITLSDMTMRIGNTGKPAMTLDHAKAAITSQTWSIVENNAAGTTIDASTGVITAGTTPGTVTVKVVAVDAMNNEVLSNTCTVTIVNIFERVDVTGDITWNWNEAANTSNVAVATANGLALANYINGEKWQKISGTHGDYAYNTNASGSYQGKGKLAFHTTVPGIVKVTARRISHNANIMLGDRLIGEVTDQLKTFPAMYVPAGEVEIIADATEGMRVTKIEFKATADYTRPVNPAYLGTLCWTNNAVLGGATLYKFVGKNENNYLEFEDVPENRIEAGKPYIFMPENGNTEIKVYNTDNNAVGAPVDPETGIYGTLVDKDLYPSTDVDLYYFSANHIWAVKDFTVDKITIPANFCYVNYTEVLEGDLAPVNPAPGRRRVTMGVQGSQIATGMGEIEASETPMKVMIDGQLFIIRGEKMFDATGKLVK